MMKTPFALVLALLVSACAVAPRQMYDGPERPSNEVASYSLWNYLDFFGGPQIYTVSVDARVTEREMGFVSITPGQHRVRVSFRDTKNSLLPGLMTGHTFQGWYDIAFTAKAGKSYAPIFNQNLPPESRGNEMCIAEFEQPGDLAKSREIQTYLACGMASIPPTPENIKLCQDMLANPKSGGRVYEEFCFKHR